MEAMNDLPGSVIGGCNRVQGFWLGTLCIGQDSSGVSNDSRDNEQFLGTEQNGGQKEHGRHSVAKVPQLGFVSVVV